MSRIATVRPGQTLADIAIEHCGSLAAWAEIARLNGLGLTAEIAAGQTFSLPDATEKRVVRILLEGGHHPAAGSANLLEGIDFWGIEYDFIIS